MADYRHGCYWRVTYSTVSYGSVGYNLRFRRLDVSVRYIGSIHCGGSNICADLEPKGLGSMGGTGHRVRVFVPV